MKELFKNLRHDKMTLYAFVGSFLTILFALLFIILSYNSLPPYIPVFNQLPWGEERITETYGIFIPLLIAFFVFIFNFVSSSYVYDRSPLISRILAFTSFLVSLLSLLFIVRTVLVVL